MPTRRSRWALVVFGLALGLLDLVAGGVLQWLWPAGSAPAAPASDYRVASPLYHHDLRPNVSVTAAWGDHRYPMRTNSLGFRDARVRDVPLVAPGRRVLLIGDSVTEGIGVPYEDTFAGRLAAALGGHGVEVLNAAVVSYAPSIYERKLRYVLDERGLRVDEVVVFLDISDVRDEALCYDTDAGGRIVDAPGSPLLGVSPGDSSTRRPWWSWTASGRLVHAVKNMVYGSGGWLLPVGADRDAAYARLADDDLGDWTVDRAAYARFGVRGLERARAAMDRLHALLARRGVALTLVVYPWPAQILAHDRPSIQETFWRDWAAANDVSFVDLFPLLVVDGDPWPTIRESYVPWDVHFSAAGHARVADAVLPVLADHAARAGAATNGASVAP
jgi:lysophospholipase L1-like esterase